MDQALPARSSRPSQEEGEFCLRLYLREDGGIDRVVGWTGKWRAPDCNASVPSVTIALLAIMVKRWPKSVGSKQLPVKESVSR
jgi:hypothetical protein